MEKKKEEKYIVLKNVTDFTKIVTDYMEQTPFKIKDFWKYYGNIEAQLDPEDQKKLETIFAMSLLSGVYHGKLNSRKIKVEKKDANYFIKNQNKVEKENKLTPSYMG